MQPEQIQRIKRKINNRIKSGDFKILAEVLKIAYGNANSRYKRSEERAVLKMQQIVIGREKLTKRLQN